MTDLLLRSALGPDPTCCVCQKPITRGQHYQATTRAEASRWEHSRCDALVPAVAASRNQDELAKLGARVEACLPATALQVSHATGLTPHKADWMLERLERAKRVIRNSDGVWFVKVTPPRSRPVEPKLI
jgi:hypothetical protein